MERKRVRNCEGGTSAQKLGGFAPDFDSRFGGIEATGDSSATKLFYG